jgi:outer membrane receptor protein involved in Fe transport
VYDRQVRDNLNWFANYTYLREDVTNRNEPLIPGPDYPTAPEPPTHLAAAGLRTEISGTRVSVTGRYSSDYMALNRLMSTAAPVDSFVVFDVKASRPVGDGKLSLLIENIFDTDYETMPAFPRPGRSYLASYQLSF